MAGARKRTPIALRQYVESGVSRFTGLGKDAIAGRPMKE